MSQYNSRLYIAVRKVEDWEKLSDLNLTEYGFVEGATFGADGTTAYYIDGMWSCFEHELNDIAKQIAERIPDCLILADTNNINVDPYNFIVYYFGDTVWCDEVEGDVQWETCLDDPFEWLEAHDINVNEKRREYLKIFGFEG